MDRQPEPRDDDFPAPGAPAGPLGYESRPLPARPVRRGDHARGKLVVLALVGLGLVLGLVALPFRKPRPDRPATRPVTAPANGPATRPVTAPAGGPASRPA